MLCWLLVVPQRQKPLHRLAPEVAGNLVRQWLPAAVFVQEGRADEGVTPGVVLHLLPGRLWYVQDLLCSDAAVPPALGDHRPLVQCCSLPPVIDLQGGDPVHHDLTERLVRGCPPQVLKAAAGYQPRSHCQLVLPGQPLPAPDYGVVLATKLQGVGTQEGLQPGGRLCTVACAHLHRRAPKEAAGPDQGSTPAVAQDLVKVPLQDPGIVQGVLHVPSQRREHAQASPAIQPKGLEGR